MKQPLSGYLIYSNRSQSCLRTMPCHIICDYSPKIKKVDICYKNFSLYSRKFAVKNTIIKCDIKYVVLLVVQTLFPFTVFNDIRPFALGALCMLFFNSFSSLLGF